MKLLETSVYNLDGVIGAQLGYDEPVTIRVKYEINEPVRVCYVGIELLTSIGVSVFPTADHDADMSMSEDRQLGIYEGEVTIPREFLNPGEYMVRIWIADGFAVVCYEGVDALCFSVMDTGTPGSHFGQDSRRSLLQPISPGRQKTWICCKGKSPLLRGLPLSLRGCSCRTASVPFPPTGLCDKGTKRYS